MSGFETTRWSLVVGSRDDGEAGRTALAELLQAYRGAIVAYVRRRGFDAAHAEDLAQGFLLHFLEHGLHLRADPARGAFRPWLLAALRNFIASELAGEQALKRGGGQPPLALDDAPEPASDADPAREFDRAWAMSVLRLALQRLQHEADASGRAPLLAELRPFLLEAPEAQDYAAAAARLGMRRNTLAVAVNRMRQRLRELVREALADTVGSGAALDAELRELRGFLHD